MTRGVGNAVVDGEGMMMKSLRRVALVGVVIAVLLAAQPEWVGASSTSSACPSAGQIAVRTNDLGSIHVIDAGTCPMRTLVAGGSDTFVTDPVWSPHGDAVAYGWSHWIGPVVEVTEIRVVPLRDGRQTTVWSLPAVGYITEIDWSPDGRRFAFSLFTYNYPVGAATWTTVGSTQRIYVVNADGTGLRTISTVNSSFDADPSWAPDSRRLAYTSWLPTPRVVVVDADATVPLPKPISPSDVLASSPAWSPTGRQIAFLANAVDQILAPPDLWVMNAGGGGARKILSNVWSPAAWSPDGRFLVAASSEVGAEGLWVMTQWAGGARRLTFQDARAPAWSPNGGIIAFIRSNGMDPDASAHDAVWTIRPDGQGSIRISEPLAYGYSAPIWRPS